MPCFIQLRIIFTSDFFTIHTLADGPSVSTLPRLRDGDLDLDREKHDWHRHDDDLNLHDDALIRHAGDQRQHSAKYSELKEFDLIGHQKDHELNKKESTPLKVEADIKNIIKTNFFTIVKYSQFAISKEREYFQYLIYRQVKYVGMSIRNR
ncbi:hypothetical protein OUZ56_010540 [Daphnia magna]|uniref:Uncharacterized protein n=1 Tax=Daphnia magna TaxID=35525 RepID=A0ABR0AIT0_9CRUS|nr:hypothetical protein OUZ56_010540 [Daphnia magna]